MSESVDPYTDPETGILRNRIGARTQAALDQAEGDLSVHRLVELADRYPVAPSGDLDELRGIHRHLFQDLYEWAGRTRTVDIRKPDGQPFLPASRIEVGTRFVFEELRADNHLRSMSRPTFIERLAHHYDALNYAHPFREGNGRAQRVFWSRVARDAGWHLDWRRVSAERNNEASRAAMERSDLRPLREMFDAITTARRPRERGTPRAALDAARLAFGAPATEATRTTPTTFEAGTRRLPPGRMSDRSPGIGD
ncbi:Fic/DOC family protein [Propionicicella superfundia]|jgi:cell filamentation protein|uniref:Fic/DOC family protein n=1 Tax=Propionicicella superfundia TaxID=348582 RepID=UPI000491F215|nr:Fic family protein [Propionicicella superfundia]